MLSRSSHRLGSGPFITPACLVLILAGMTRCAYSAPDEFSQRLEGAIELTQRELDEEVARMEGERGVREQQLDDLRAACEKFAGQLVDRKIHVARKQQVLASLRRERETLWAEHVAWQRALAEVKLICRDMHRELAELAATLPVSEHRAGQKRELDWLGVALEQEDTARCVSLSLGLVESFLREARTAAVYDAQVVDPQGVPIRANLLRAGLSLFAYHVPETSQVAIAVLAPHGENGFRWREGLPNGMRRRIVAAIDQAATREGPSWVPIDVSGTIADGRDIAGRTLWDRLCAGGVVMVPLAFLAACLVILITDRFFVLLRESRYSLRFCEQVLDLCGRGEFQKAEDLARRTRGVLSRTLAACLTHRHSPPTVLDDAIQETFLREFPKLERFLPAIGMLSSVAPMLGLLGTVTGIIATFDVIVVAGSGRPHLMAGGISEALVTTAAGLVIAIPGLLAHSVLSGKVNSVIADAERFAATLSNLIKQQARGASQSSDE